jgi:hypothetical protein
VSSDARDKKPCTGAVLGDDALTSATNPVGEKSIQLSANLPLSTLTTAALSQIFYITMNYCP